MPNFDIDLLRDEHAGYRSALFVENEMPRAVSCEGREAVLDAAIEAAKLSAPGNLICEFGVCDGHTINHIADRVSCLVHGFDSFKGLPEAWRPGFDAGHFARQGVPEVRPNVRLHVGWFEATLPAWLDANAGQIALLHIDSDLYSSARTVLETLRGRIGLGTVIVFDEFFNYRGFEAHEFRAWHEFLETTGAQAEGVAYNRIGEQAAFKVTQI